MTEDPDVILHTVVGRTAMFHREGSTMVSRSAQGLLYVKGGELHHENLLGKRLCCKCIRNSWPVSEIKQITVMNGETLTVSGPKTSKVLSLTPGVKMIFQDATGNCQTLVTALLHTTENSANQFSTRLRQCVDAASDKHR